MMKVISGIALSALAVLLACCTGISEVRDVRIEGTQFNHYLARGYKELAVYEAREKHDNAAADYFSQKALKAAKNIFVEPTLIEERNIPRESMAEVAHARTELATALISMLSADTKKPLAEAQVKFDCWLENIEEKNGAELAESCRNDFVMAMEEIAGSFNLSEAFMVFFSFNSARPEYGSDKTLGTVARILKENEGLKVEITGNTDTSGPESYNESLSLRRAKAVKKALSELGVPECRTELHAGGEDNLLVRTPDGTREHKNRRADILITRK